MRAETRFSLGIDKVVEIENPNSLGSEVCKFSAFGESTHTKDYRSMRNPVRVATVLSIFALFSCGPGSSLIGRVSAPDGGVESAEVTILDSSRKPVETVLTGSGGKFALKSKLAPGVYEAEIKKPGFRTASKTFSYPDNASLEVSLIPLLRVKGIVRLPDQSVAPKAIVWFKYRGDERPPRKAIADEGGNYLVEELDVGDYNIEVVTPDGLHATEIENYKLDGQTAVTELELLLDPAKRSIDAVDGEVQKARVIQDVDAPTGN